MKAPLLLLLMPVAMGVGEVPPGQQEPAESISVEAQIEALQNEVRDLDRRVDRLSSDLDDAADLGLVLFLFGAFCALWAKNTGRGPWLWFFMGVFFNFVTVLVLLSKNADDQRALRDSGQVS